MGRPSRMSVRCTRRPVALVEDRPQVRQARERDRPFAIDGTHLDEDIADAPPPSAGSGRYPDEVAAVGAPKSVQPQGAHPAGGRQAMVA